MKDRKVERHPVYMNRFAKFRFEDAAPIILIIGLILASNLNALSAGFVWDDRALITNNALIKSWTNIPVFFKQPFLGIYYRPVVMLSFAMDYAIWGLRPFGFHLTNLLLHAANALLVFFIVKDITSNRQTALFAAILFGAHPAHKGIVAVPDRTGVLSAFFMLAAFILFIKHRRRSAGNGSMLFLAASVVSAAMGFFSKEEVIALPLILIVADAMVLELGFERRSSAGLFRHIPFFAVACSYLFVRSRVLGGAATGLISAFLIEPMRRLATVPAILADYLLLLAFPINLDYEPRTALATSLFEPRIVLPLLLMLVLAASIPLLVKKRKALLFGVLWYFIVFIPMSNIIPIYPEAAQSVLFTPIHFLYLPSIGIFLLAGEGFGWLGRSAVRKTSNLWRRRTVISLFCFIIFSFSLLSMKRNAIWKDELRLYRYIVDMHPGNHRMRVNLGNVYLERGQINPAIHELEYAVALAPDVAWYRNSLALAYQARGWPEKAAREFRDSLRLDPNSSMVYSNLAAVYRSQGKLSEAITTGTKAITLNPSSPAAYINLALTYKDAGNLAEAEKYLLTALALDPDSAEAHNGLGIVYASQGDFQKARAEWEKALRIRTDMAEARENLNRLEAMGW